MICVYSEHLVSEESVHLLTACSMHFGLFDLVGCVFIFDAARSVCSLDGFLTELRRRSGDIFLALPCSLLELFLLHFED